MSRVESKAKKLAILAAISEEKALLFGKISPKEKGAAWERVRAKALALGMMTEDRDWQYCRDKMYSVWKSRAMAKVIARKSGEGRQVLLDEVDHAILDLVDSRSNGVVEIKVEAFAPGPLPEEIELEDDESLGSESQEQPETSNKRRREASPTSTPRKDHLEIKLLEMDIYLKKLEALALERQLGLPPSRFTRDVVE